MASHNLHRRDLDRSQKAILALEFEKLYAEEAAKRKRAGKSDLRADLPEGHDERRPREQAARVVGVSGRLVQNAKRVVAARCDAPCRRLAGLP